MTFNNNVYPWGTSQLAPLHNITTDALIPGFPFRSSDIQRLTGEWISTGIIGHIELISIEQELVSILEALQCTPTGDLDRMRYQFRIAIGMPM